MNKKIKLILLAVIIVFHLVNNFIWITASPFHVMSQGKDWQTGFYFQKFVIIGKPRSMSIKPSLLTYVSTIMPGM